MNIIEQAAKRLEELQRAGVAVPWAAAGFDTPPAGAAVPPPPVAAPASATEAAPVAATAAAVELVAKQAPSEPPAPAPAPRQSRQVNIDIQRLMAMGFVVPGGPRSPTADEYRVIKRPLLKNATMTGEAALRRGNLIQVVSAVPGEGKTFTAVNLALSIAAELDHSVLLVDADVVRPSVFSRLGLSAERGLLDLLRDPSMSLPDVMLSTNIPKLSLLPAGTASADSTELLASASMDRLLDDLATRYADRIVIFDSPPVLAATEARVLATKVGQVLAVIEAGTTSRELVTEAFAALSSCPAVMAVLNKYDGPPLAGPYGY